jgi:pilus assembly protein CpaF
MDKFEFNTGIITNEKIKLFLPYLKDNEITDVDWNGKELWVKNIYNQKIKIPAGEHKIDKKYIENFTAQLATSMGKLFNKEDNVLEAQTLDFRIECVHESKALSGRTCCIRKTSREVRMSYKYLIDSLYTTEPILNLLINCAIAKCNIIVGGTPGVGKTEFAKLLSLFIPEDERVITIEDSPEWHYNDLKPGADCIELQVDEDNFTYTTALKSCMRLNPQRIFLSEIRSIEAKSLIECWSIGVKGFSTLHCERVVEMVDRILNMMPTRADAERIENNVYTYLDVGVIINTKISDEGKEYRYIEEVGFFYRNPETRENKISMIVEDGILITRALPEFIAKKLTRNSINDGFDIKSDLKERYYEIT